MTRAVAIRVSYLILALFLCLQPSLLHADSVGTIAFTGEPEDYNPWHFRFWGSYKSIAAVTYLRQEGIYPKDTSPFAEQRARFMGALSRDWFRFEFANEVCLKTQVPNDPTISLPNTSPQAAFNGTTEIYSSSEVQLLNRLDRAFVQLSFNDVELKIGKQVVGMGVGHLFSSISQVPRLPFVVVDSEFPFTEDAATLRWNGPMLFEARFLPKVTGQEKHNFHFRLGERTNSYDFVITAGQSDDKMFLGLEAAKNLWGFVFRGEAIGYEFGEESRFQGLIGIDRAFTPELSAELEFFHNGFGESDSLLYTLESEHRSSPYKGRWYVGAKVNATLHPLLKTSFAGVTNLNDSSTLFHFSLNYSLTDNLELLAGQYFTVHSDPYAEYGGTFPLTPTLASGIPELSYLLLKLHF